MQSYGEVGQATAQKIVEPPVKRLATHLGQGGIQERGDEYCPRARFAESAAM